MSDPELVLLLRCTGCRRPVARLIRFGSRLYWNATTFGRPCTCGRFPDGPPDPATYADRVVGVQGVSPIGKARAPITDWA